MVSALAGTVLNQLPQQPSHTTCLRFSETLTKGLQGQAAVAGGGGLRHIYCSAP